MTSVVSDIGNHDSSMLLEKAQLVSVLGSGRPPLTKAEPDVVLTLSLDQALVLFEWLSREGGKSALPIQHPAEQKVLWMIEGQLEQSLVAPLQPHYEDAISNARARIVGGE